MPDFWESDSTAPAAAPDGPASISDMIAGGAEVMPSSLLGDVNRGVVFYKTPYGVLPHVPTFCCSCAKPGPMVVQDAVLENEFASYICEPCAEKYPQQYGVMVCPDEVFFEAVKQHCLDTYGRELTAAEQLAQIGDVNSTLSKMARSRYDATASWNTHR